MRKTRLIYNSIVVSILLALAILPFIKVPISVSARGAIKSSQENSPLISLVGGRVVYSKLHSNNQFVKKGDTLLVLASDNLKNKQEYQKDLAYDYTNEISDLTQLLESVPDQLRTGLYQKEWSAFQNKMAEIEIQIDLAYREYERNAILYNEGIIPLTEYDKSSFYYKQLKEQIKSSREQQMATWQLRKRELEQKMVTLNSDLEAISIDADNHVVRASLDGRITKFQGVHNGSFVIQGQHLADISSDELLIAECLVPAISIGFISPGQSVKFQIDTYNYNQWGMASGEVMDIDHNPIVNEPTGEAFFRVRCELHDKVLTLKNGCQGAIGKGNTYTARFYLLDRTLWQLLFDRIDDWFNPSLAKIKYSSKRPI